MKNRRVKKWNNRKPKKVICRLETCGKCGRQSTQKRTFKCPYCNGHKKVKNDKQ